MGKLQKAVASFTEDASAAYTNSAFNMAVGNAISAATDAYDVAQNAVLLTLSKAWIGIGMLRPAETGNVEHPDSVWQSANTRKTGVYSNERTLDRFDSTKLWSLEFGDYFMPVSQTFSLRAKKRLNVSSLVDGIDIIQQTRKEAKIIDCTLRISFNERQTNLQIVDVDNQVQQLSRFLTDLYESDAVFTVENETINRTFGVTDVIMTEYKFLPATGKGTFTFEFSLMEVKYGDNVLTFDLRQINDATPQQ